MAAKGSKEKASAPAKAPAPAPVPTPAPEHGESSHVEAQHGKSKFSWTARGGLAVAVAGVAIRAIGITYASRTGNTANVQPPTTVPSIAATDHSTATGNGPARSVDAKDSAVTETGNATNNSNNTANSHNTTNAATANGPGSTAQAGNITNQNIKASDLDWQKIKDLQNASPGLAWQSDAQVEYIALPFMPNRGTKITPPFSTAPFVGHNRKAVVELKNVSEAWQKRFAFQVKAMQPLGDEDRQAGNATAGQTFTILPKQEDDRNFYLAWRGSDNQQDRLSFAADNDQAVIVIRLLK